MLFPYFSGMGKDMIIELLRLQLEKAEASNEVLLAQISSLTKTIDEQSKTIKEMEAANATLNATIKSLEKALLNKGESIEAIERKLKGLAKLLNKTNEKAKPEKASSPTDNQSSATGGANAASATPAKKEWPKTNHGAKHNPHVELVTVNHTVEPDDPNFDILKALAIGSRTVVRYIMVPMRFEKHVYQLKAYKIGETVYSGKAPSTPILNSCYDGSFIAGIAYLRYLKAMPVERIVSMFQDHGFDLNKATAGKLLAGAAMRLEKIHECLKDVVLTDTYKAGDETYHKVLVGKINPEDTGSRKGYIWSLLAMTLRLMYYFYDDGSRSEDVLLDKLEGKTLAGALQSDGLNVYKKVAEKYGLVKLSCFQHCRRPFYDLKGNPDADAVIRLVGSLYHEEHKHKIGTDHWTAEDNLKWRREYAPPIMAELKRKLEEIVSNEEKYPPKSEMRKAASYMLNEWQGLENIFTSGEYRLDNNIEEILQRYISMSRRNSLFFGSHKGAERGAIFYSLACSCKLQKKNFFKYLSDILNKSSLIPDGSPASAYRHLLPDVWEEPKTDKEENL